MTDLIKGRLTEAEKDRIAHLAETLRDPKPAAIARRINRHRATVTWFMITQGLIKRQIVYRPEPIVRRRRDGVVTVEYTRDQDQRLLELRRARRSLREDRRGADHRVRRAAQLAQRAHQAGDAGGLRGRRGVSDAAIDETDDACSNCGGEGLVAGCFEDTCSCDGDPDDPHYCCAPSRCDWCRPRKRADG